MQRRRREHFCDKLRKDKCLRTLIEEDRRRRTIIIERKDTSFGFTLQTYGIHHRKEGEIELLTYVDFVDQNGPAAKAGMRPGDVIISINGRDMEKADHRTIVKYIQSCEKTMRMVVLFEDCVRKVELHMRYLKLKRILHQRASEYEILRERENQILKNSKHKKCINNTNDAKVIGLISCKSLELSLKDIFNSNYNSAKVVDYEDPLLYTSTLPRVRSAPKVSKETKCLAPSTSHSYDCLREDEDAISEVIDGKTANRRSLSCKEVTTEEDKDFFTQL